MRTSKKYALLCINPGTADYTFSNPIFPRTGRKMQMKRSEQKENIDPRRKQLLEDIRKTKYALDCAYSNFENVIDPDLIDCSIYELQAVQMRYRFLLRQAELLDSVSG